MLDPLLAECHGVDPVGLLRPGGLHRAPLELRNGVGVGFLAVVLGAPAGDQLVVLGLDLGAALREHVAQVLGYDGQVDEATFLVGPPVDAEAAGQLGSEGGVVDPADGGLLLLQEPGVQREPPPGRVLDLGRDDGVRMELGVDGAGGVLAEQGRGDAAGVDLVDAVGAPPGDRPVCLEPAERRVDGGFVGSEHLGPHPRIRSEGPQH